MEYTINPLTPKEKIFLENLRLYIDKPVYYYGSVQRNDYFPGKSDIDIVIFTENENSTIFLLSNYLNINKNEFKKSIYNLQNKIIPGFKVKYIENQLNIEISVYNENYKDIIMNEYTRNIVIPFYISIPLFIIKYLYYDLKVIDNPTYKKLKSTIMNEGGKTKFILLDYF